mmetsp:Transcript_131692/g.380900  ORF Transcript_131692/g.380900 Transcript_131692/m.380900 type:complete len:384 (+) Transcript_131692:108-1259(+)
MGDEANKDEVEKCKRIAENAMAAGDVDKATRFLQKAKRMLPGDASIDALLAKAASGAAGGSTPTARSAGGASGSDEGPRFRPSAGASPNAGPSSESASATRTGKDGRQYTSDQMALVQRILRTKDYYDILEVPKDSNEDVVKKAYKKLALKLHPDKNKAPGAEEAFKKLSKAVQCLTDAEKKQVYDRYGDEDRIPQQHRHHYHQEFHTAEDVFAAFFGQGMFNQAHHHQHHPQDAQAQRAGPVQILPILLLVLLTAASNFASNSATVKFSLSPNAQYRNERSTASLDVPYYVADGFPEHYPDGTRSLAEFERQVEIHYVRNLHSECDYQEKTMYKKVMIARRKGNEEELAAARRHPRPACKEIETIKRSHANIFRSAMYMGVY